MLGERNRRPLRLVLTALLGCPGRHAVYSIRTAPSAVPIDLIPRTWEDGAIQIGRVYKLTTISRGGWWWGCNAHLEWFGSSAGIAESRDEACHAVEAAYDALVARIAAAKNG